MNKTSTQKINNKIVDIEGKLYQALGIVRMISRIEVEGENLKKLEAVTWGASAVEDIIEGAMGMLEDLERIDNE